MKDECYVIIACHPDKGMKSYGSKAMIKFENNALIQHQINWIKQHNPKGRIFVFANFDIQKIQKHFANCNIDIIYTNTKNPIIMACDILKDKNLCFIDYGCIFDYSILKSFEYNVSNIVCLSNTKKNNNLNVGCVVCDGYIENMFIDLPNNKFCNLFTISKQDSIKINQMVLNDNLLYFEIINKLIDCGSKIKPVYLKNNFLYFNNMRQKNAINKFIKKTYN